MNLDDELRRAAEDDAGDPDTAAKHRAAQAIAGPLSALVALTFVGGLAYGAYTLYQSGSSTWLCLLAALVAIPISMLGGIVRRLGRKI